LRDLGNWATERYGIATDPLAGGEDPEENQDDGI
jgi:endogenous inhibitor of DNA gyrase (YacG/DUF329 family)